MDQNIAQILLFVDDVLMFHQAVGVNLSFNRFGILLLGGGAHGYQVLHLCKEIIYSSGMIGTPKCGNSPYRYM